MPSACKRCASWHSYVVSRPRSCWRNLVSGLPGMAAPMTAAQRQLVTARAQGGCE
jgi:hypothetical protein